MVGRGYEAAVLSKMMQRHHAKCDSNDVRTLRKMCRSSAQGALSRRPSSNARCRSRYCGYRPRLRLFGVFKSREQAYGLSCFAVRSSAPSAGLKTASRGRGPSSTRPSSSCERADAGGEGAAESAGRSARLLSRDELIREAREQVVAAHGAPVVRLPYRPTATSSASAKERQGGSFFSVGAEARC